MRRRAPRPASGCNRRGPKSGRSSPRVDSRPRAPSRPRSAQLRRARGRRPLAVQQHGEPEPVRRAGHSGRAPRRTRHRGPSGPGTRSGRRRSRRSAGARREVLIRIFDPPDRLPRAPRQHRAGRARRAGPRASNTLRWWSASVCTSSRQRVECARQIVGSSCRSRPSETFGTAREQRRWSPARSLEHVPAGVERRRPSTVGAGVQDDHVEVDRNRHRPADPGACAERDVDGAEDLLVLERVARQPRALVGADADLRQVGARSPCVRSNAMNPLQSPPSAAVNKPPDRSRQRRRLIARCRPTPASPRRRSSPSPPSGAMNPSPHGQVAEHPRPSVRTPSSEIPGRSWRSSVKSVPRGQPHVRRGRPVQQLPRPPASAPAIASKSPAIIRASMSSVTPGIVAPRAPASLARRRATTCG